MQPTINRLISQFQADFEAFRAPNPLRGNYQSIPNPGNHSAKLAEFSDLRLPPRQALKIRWIDNMLDYYRYESAMKPKTSATPTSRTEISPNPTDAGSQGLPDDAQTAATASPTSAARPLHSIDTLLDLRDETANLQPILKELLEPQTEPLTPPDKESESVESEQREAVVRALMEFANRTVLTRIRPEESNNTFARQVIEYEIGDEPRTLEVIRLIRPITMNEKAWSDQLLQPATMRQLNRAILTLKSQDKRIKIINTGSTDSKTAAHALLQFHKLNQKLVAPKTPMMRAEFLDHVDSHVRAVLKTQGRTPLPSFKSYQAIVRSLHQDLISNRLLTPKSDPQPTQPVNRSESHSQSAHSKETAVTAASAMTTVASTTDQPTITKGLMQFFNRGHR